VGLDTYFANKGARVLCSRYAVETPKLRSYTALMEVHLTPEQQLLLADLAALRGRDTDTLAQEAISRIYHGAQDWP